MDEYLDAAKYVFKDKVPNMVRDFRRDIKEKFFIKKTEDWDRYYHLDPRVDWNQFTHLLFHWEKDETKVSC